MPYSSDAKAAWNAQREASSDQEGLREEYEGGRSAKRRQIKIPPLKDPEVNPEVYRDVIPILTRGFLTEAAEINGALFVFKSLNHHEFEMVRLVGGFRPNREPLQRFWDIFLAYGVFMLDGQNVLLDRERAVRELSDTFANLPRDAKGLIVRHLSELNRRASVATVLTEAYATEAYSRYRWSQVAGMDLMSPTVTGIAGTDRLGLNYAQYTWRSINYYEDIHDQMEREWENAKFIGSCFAGKGIQKVYNQDVDRRRKRKEDIISRKDAVLRYALYGETPSDTKLQGNAVVLAARSTEELSKQLEADLRGDKDWHDRVIEAYDRHIQDTHQQQQDRIKALVASHSDDFHGLSVIGGTDPNRTFSAAEVAEAVQRRKQIQAQQVARQMAQGQFAEKVERFNAKIKYDVATPDNVETSVGTNDTRSTDARPIQPNRPVGKPFRR